MKRMTKQNVWKRIFVFIFVFIVVFLIVFLALRRNKQGMKDEMYMYDTVNPQCNYSESNVLYLDDSGILHLIETATGKDVVYCDRPNCTHEGFSHNNENPSCPAAFYGLNTSGPVLYNGHLYSIGNMADGDVQTQYLYEMDPNGENRKRVATLEGVQNLRYVLYRDKYVIGAYYNRSVINDEGQIINDNKPEAGIFVISLDTDAVWMGDKITGEQANITGIYYDEGVVYYSIIRFRDDITETMLEDASENDAESFAYDNMLYEIYQYDIANETTSLLKAFDHINNLQLLDGDAYYESKEGYFMFDKESGQVKELAIETDAGTLGGLFAKQGDSLYYEIFNSDGNEVTYYRMRDDKSEELMKMDSEDSFGIENICGQSVYIRYTDDKGRFCLGVLDIDDLNQGEFKPRELRCYDEDGDADAETDGDADVKVITFAVPDISRVDDNNLRHFNEALIKDGYEYRLELKYLAYEEYNTQLRNELKNGDADIAFLGLGDSEGNNNVYALIHSGLVLELDEILSQETGKTLYSAFPQKLWESVKCDKHIYSIPSTLVDDHGVYAAFNRDYISDDVIDEWDGSIEGIYEIIKDTEWNNSGTPRFQYLINDYSFEDMIGCEIRYGLVFDYDSMTIENPLESEKLIGYLTVLDQMKKDGYMNTSIECLNNSGLNSAETLKNIEAGDYMVALSSGTVNAAFKKDNITVKALTPYLSSRINGSIAISNNTDNIDDVVEFLGLLYGDSKYSNILLYGQEDEDYKVVDGVAVNMDGTDLDDMYVNKLCLDLFINTYPVKGEDYENDRRNEFFSFYDGVKTSPFIGFEPDTADFNNISHDVDTFMNSLTTKTVEEAAEATRDKLISDGMTEYLIDVRSQWEAYRQ